MFVTLANDDHNVRRATVPYAPLYPTFQESLNRFRRGEHSELIQRSAERVVHNVGVYDTRRSSEDGSVNLVVIHPADIPSAGPQEQSIDNEVQPILPVGYEGPLNQPEGDTFVLCRLLSPRFPRRWDLSCWGWGQAWREHSGSCQKGAWDREGSLFSGSG